MHQELKHKVTLQLLWSEYMAQVGSKAYRYSQFCHRYRQWLQGQAVCATCTSLARSC